MTPIAKSRDILRNPGTRTDDAIIAAADMVMKHGTPCEWWTANELRRAAFKRQGEVHDREAWLENEVRAKIEAAKRTAYPLAFVDNPRRGVIRGELPAAAMFVAFAAVVLVGGLSL